MITPVNNMSDDDLETLPRLGWLVWHIVRNVKRSWSEARLILSNIGFDPDLLPITTPKKAFLLALNETRSIKQKDCKIIVRPVFDNAEVIRQQVSMEKKDMVRLKLDYEACLLIDFEKESETLKCTCYHMPDGVAAPIMDVVVNQYVRFKDFASNDTLSRFSYEDGQRCNAIAVRPMGGVWFVPDKHTERIKAMEEVFKSFGVGCEYFRHPVIDTPFWKEKVKSMAEEELMKEVEDMASELNGFLDAYKDKGVEIASINVRLMRYKSMRDRLIEYENLLSYKASTIHGRVQELEDKARLVLSGGLPSVPIIEKKPRGFAVTKRKKDLVGIDKEAGF